MRLSRTVLGTVVPALLACSTLSTALAGGTFDGRFFRGAGDTEYLQLLDISRRMFDADPEYQCLPMLYFPSWNGLVEGPTWDAWWIQNSYGTTYCALPFLDEPYTTFLQNSQDLWFDQMGDNVRVGAPAPFNWIAPDGCLCDAAKPGWVVYRQGDGQTAIHDWALEFTAAGILMQSELLLISRDKDDIPRYLPKLERAAKFIESRRDPKNDLFLAGPAANLLAPSYAGYKKPDGTYDKAYLTGLSVTYIAALDRLIELETLAGNENTAKLWACRRDKARKALAALATEEGYFIRSLDPDGVKHGLFGAEKHGYLETSPNHDAIAFRVVDDEQARKIYAKIASIPGLRPHDFILPNYPSYDDMYEKAEGLWGFGTWVNGGHWSTCEARMIMAYYRLGQYEDARRSMRQLLTFAKRWRMDNPLTKFGSDVYQPKEAINLCYDSFGPPAAMVRGLFEYLYTADSLLVMPHIPPGITQLEQKFPIRFGTKRIYLSVAGAGPITGVWVNNRACATFNEQQIRLKYEDLPPAAEVLISLGSAATQPAGKQTVAVSTRPTTVPSSLPASMPALAELDPKAETRLKLRLTRLARFVRRLNNQGLGFEYEACHARLTAQFMMAMQQRQGLLADGTLAALPEPARTAAAKCYLDTADKLYDGLDALMKKYVTSGQPKQKDMAELWLNPNNGKEKK